MAYSVKYRLDYCNGKLQNARLDIEVDGYSGAINPIEATPEPFILKYNSEKGDRSGYFHTTEATIKVYQDDKFNIDDLLTSDETAIRVKFYIENSIYWVGFVLPDFYEVEIGSSPVVTMVATDRIGTLKNQTIKRDSDAIGSYHRMIEKSLAKTGLNLPIQSLINFNLSSKPTRDFLQNTGGQWLRVDDDMEGSISAYEVVRSILVLANATLFQRNGKWHIQNKLEFESRNATKTIDKINTGGSRMINPPAQEVGVYSEFAGGLKYPNNYNFDSLIGWTTFGGFNARIENREVIGFSNGIPIYGDVSENKSLANNNSILSGVFLKSQKINVISARENAVGVKFEINVTMQQGAIAYANVYAQNGDKFKVLTRDGFIDVKESGINKNIGLRGEGSYDADKLVSTSFSFDGVIELPEDEGSVNQWGIYIRIFGNWHVNTTTFVNFAYVTFDSKITQQGNIFKVKQGVNFTKNQEIDTTIFGDRIRKGINGYFYNYPTDEKSIQFAKIGNIYESLGLSWMTPFDSTPEPLLLHSARQRAIMFSAPHNIINATVEGQFDAYDVYNVCGKKYVMVEAVYDFFRNETQLKIEEVKYDNTEKTDYVYSYFGGENTENIKGVSSISGGGTSSGGGRGLIKEDENGNYYSEEPFYSLGGLSAYGFSEVGGGTGEGGIINVIDNLTSTSKTDPLSANQGRYLKTLIDNIEVGEGGQVIVDWEAITGKPSTFTPSAHSHIIGDVTGLQSALDGKASLAQLDSKEDAFTKNSAFNKNFGTGLNDVARGNHTHTFASLTSIPTTLSGYGITDAVTLNTSQTISGAKTFSSLLTASAGTNTPKISFGNGWTAEGIGEELQFKLNGVIQAKIVDGALVSMGEVTAFY